MLRLTKKEQLEILENIKRLTGAEGVFVAVSEKPFSGWQGELVKMAVIMEGVKHDPGAITEFLNLAIESIKTATPINEPDETSIPSPYFGKI